MKNHSIDGRKLIPSKVEYTSTSFEIPGNRIVKNIGMITGYSQQDIISQSGLAGAIIKKLTDNSLIRALKNDAFEDLLRTAEKQGANAIIGIQMEISSLSGSGVMNNYSNVFCNIIGTAVLVESDSKQFFGNEENQSFQNESYSPITNNTPMDIPDSSEDVVGIIENAESCKIIAETIESFITSKGIEFDSDLFEQIKEKVTIERMYGVTESRTRTVKQLANQLLKSLDTVNK